METLKLIGLIALSATALTPAAFLLWLMFIQKPTHTHSSCCGMFKSYDEIEVVVSNGVEQEICSCCREGLKNVI